MSNAVVTGVQPPENTDAKQSDSDRQSNQHESEYDTASDSPSDDDDDLQSGEYDDDLRSSETEDDLDEEDGDVHSDNEEGENAPEEGAEGEDGEKKKVDDDEDRSNPQYIPKKGTFYEHDDRTADNPVAKPAAEEPTDQLKAESAENVSSTVSPLPAKVPPKKPSGGDRWSHDRFDMSEQAPKSRSELVSAYGYDIRSEDGPPKVKRNKHYGRGPTKYERNWEDENAYGKQVVSKRVSRGPPKGEDFPKLNERRPRKSHATNNSRDDPSNAEGAAGEERSYNTHHRERRQGGTSRGEGRGFRGNENTREIKNRNHSGRGGRDSGRTVRRRTGGDDGHRGGDQEAQPTFNGMSFTNSNLSHGKKADAGAQEHPRNNAQSSVGDDSHRMASSSNSGRSANYGSGRLQRRDDNKPGSQHFQSQPAGSAANSSQDGGGGLPLHAPLPKSQQQVPKRYSEKRPVMRGDPQSQPQVNVAHVEQPPTQPHIQHPVQPQQPPALQGRLPQQSTGPPPPPFMSNRAYNQMEVGAQPMMTPQQAQPQPPIPVVASVVPQSQPAIAAQYANYYPADYLPPSAAQPTVGQAAATSYPAQGPVATANGPPSAQMLNYVSAMQTQPQNPAQYSQYPGYQNYTSMPIQTAPANSVAYFAPPTTTQPQQPPPRAILPQRRPTNAIPIVSPPERNSAGGKGRGRLVSDVPSPAEGSGEGKAASGGDDIDHILDNMFVRRPQQSMTTSSSSSTGGTRNKGEETDKTVNKATEGNLEEGMKDLRLTTTESGTVAATANSPDTPNET